MKMKSRRVKRRNNNLASLALSWWRQHTGSKNDKQDLTLPRVKKANSTYLPNEYDISVLMQEAEGESIPLQTIGTYHHYW